MFNRLAVLGLVAVALAGCQTAADTVSVDTIRTLRVERTDVVLDPAAKVDWPKLQGTTPKRASRRAVPN
jgi:hypothetical protein